MPRTCLVGHFCPHLSDQQRQDIINKWLKGKGSTNASKAPGCLHSVLKVLETEEDFNKFVDMKTRLDDEQRTKLIVEREGFHRSKARQMTPKLIKMLAPPGPKSYISMQTSLKRFNGFYFKPGASSSSRARPVGSTKKGRLRDLHSTARTWGDKWTQEQALNLVVGQLWSWHRKYGNDSCCCSS